jgi:ABC-2 type transport system permease protein
LLLLALNDSSGIDLEPAHILGACLALLGLGTLAASVGLAVGAITGRRAYASAGAAAIALLGYVLNSVGNQSADLEWLHTISPFALAYGNSPLSNGADWSSLGILYGIAVIALVIGTIVFTRRDVSA